MASTTYIVSELLCTLKSNYGKMPRTDIISSFSDFYSNEEIDLAKSVIIDIADKCTPKINEVKKIKPRIGDGKSRRDLEDILVIYTALDSRKESIPLLLAADTTRIPSMKDVDFSRITASFES